MITTVQVKRPRTNWKKLYVEANKDARLFEGLFATVENGLRPSDKRVIERAQDTGAYPFIPLDPMRFVRALREARSHVKDEGLRFLDVGCGVGTKVLLAARSLQQCGDDQFDGLDYEAHYAIDFARLTRGCWNRPKFINEDGRKFAGYSSYNMIYMYVPMTNHDFQRQLMLSALNRAQPGTIFVMAGCGFVRPRHDKDKGDPVEFLRGADYDPRSLHGLQITRKL